MIDFEADPGADPGFTPEVSVEPTPVTPAWTGPSQEEWQRTQDFLGAAGPILQELYEKAQPAPDPTVEQPFDPFDPASVKAYIDQTAQARASEMLAPYEPILGMVAQDRGETMAREAIESFREEVGDFDEDAALLVGSALMNPNTNPDVALRQAAEWARDFEAGIRADEREKYKAEIGQIAQAPNESPTGGLTTVPVPKVPTGARRYHEVVERVLAEATPSFPTG